MQISPGEASLQVLFESVTTLVLMSRICFASNKKIEILVPGIFLKRI